MYWRHRLVTLDTYGPISLGHLWNGMRRLWWTRQNKVGSRAQW